MLHENIKSQRLQHALSQQELANRLHVVRQTVSKWETGLSVPDAQQLLKLSEIFGVSAAELLDQPPAFNPDESLQEQLQQAMQDLENLRYKRRRNRRLAGTALLLLSVIPLILTALPFFTTGLDFPANAIGGADGPTSIFITFSSYRPNWTFPVLWLLLFAGVGTGLFWTTRRVKAKP